MLLNILTTLVLHNVKGMCNFSCNDLLLTQFILKHDFKGLGEVSLVQVIYSVLLHVLYELFVEVVKTLLLFQEVCQSN